MGFIIGFFAIIGMFFIGIIIATTIVVHRRAKREMAELEYSIKKIMGEKDG